jgi:uncharacterized protein
MPNLAGAPIATWLILAVAGFVAAFINTLAGGGPLITLGVMVLLGMDAKTANITSTVALFPGQILTGWAGRQYAKPIGGMTIPTWLIATTFGGALGGALIAVTPSTSFKAQVPWLVAFATCVYAWRAFSISPANRASFLPSFWAAPVLFILALYGGYFGGGNSFLVLALLSALGLGAREAGGIKNLWVALINAAAVVIFLIGGKPDVVAGSAIAIGGIAGGVLGGKWLAMINEKALRFVVIGIGACLTIWLLTAS